MIHNFHIPVMGLSFTIDSPIRVAHLGISSVMSISDHILIAKVRDYYRKKFSIPLDDINLKEIDARSTVIASYLNLVHDIVQINWEKHIDNLVKNLEYLNHFLSILPDSVDRQHKVDISVTKQSYT
ncbi:MAG: hypothetical protein FJY17_03025 [Bacteroidetes bacterium]|nr:hypothetical protein [Bacteroidota bacterium]